MVGVVHGESMYKKWYFEVEIDLIEQSPLSDGPPHCRIGWANTDFQPTPAGSDGFTCVGVGDDVNSYGFDGQSLWFAGRSKQINEGSSADELALYGTGAFRKGDVIGCLLDLSIPEIWFSLNGVPMKGFFREFNLNAMFFPVLSVSPKISCRFLFGDEHGRFKYGPPEGCAPIYQAMLAKQRIKLELCFTFGDSSKNVFNGAQQPLEQVAFTPAPVDITHTQVPSYIENIRDKLAENLHEIWAASKIEQGWKYSDVRFKLYYFELFMDIGNETLGETLDDPKFSSQSSKV
jgi:ryanodine receptor 2